MKKLLSLVVVGIVGMFSSGCTITPTQAKVIAQNAGIYSAVIWIAVDNPSSNQVDEVKSILEIIKEKAVNIEAGKTYTEVIYPELVKVIDTKFPPQDRPLCKAASLTLLNGLDTLFAMHPEWLQSQTLAMDITKSYCDGAVAGLSMGENSKVIQQARATSAARAKIYNSK